MTHIKYKEGYKYQLAEDYQLLTSIMPKEGTGNDFVWLGKSGLLVVKKGYAWDGPSGPTFDTRDAMRGSLVHDAFYQLMREGFLPKERRADADQVFLECLLADGMLPIRAAAWFAGVRLGAGAAADASSIHPILTAP